MFKIETVDGSLIGYVDVPRYIKVSDNGSYIQCLKREALGVAYDSKPYHIDGKAYLPNAIADVIITYEEEV